jgi:hypothetical protein
MNKVMILGGITVLVMLVVIGVIIATSEKEPEIIDTTQSSGPFQINKSVYKLGEKVFLTVEGLQEIEKGKAIFLRPLNATHMTAYSTIPFDGELKNEFNQYVEPKLLKSMKTCSVEDIVGQWEVWFKGTNYESLKFVVSEEMITDEDDKFLPVC